jgi:O-6-methylguanine DNA methyltransferase
VSTRPSTDLEAELAGLRVPVPQGVADAALLGVGLIDGAAVYDSPLGAVVVVFNVAGVASLRLGDDPTDHDLRLGRPVVAAEPPRAWRDGIAKAIERGTPGTLPLDLRDRTPFQREVLGLAAGIPRGEVRPYGWLARRAGRAGAVRAVGSVMATNPLPLIVPCHRVVRSDGTIGAYSLGGPGNKRLLLAHEGLDPDHLEALAESGARFVASSGGEVFCLPTCRHARSISGDRLVKFRHRDDAVGSGRRPCSVCVP